MSEQLTPSLTPMETLQKLFSQNKTLYAVVVKVAPNGMSRDIKHFAVYDGKLYHIDWLITQVRPEINLCKGNVAITRKGCGMDFVSDMAQRLSESLFEDRNALRPQGM